MNNIRRALGALLVPALLCISPAHATEHLAVILPSKVVTSISTDLLRVTGHWVLRTSEPALPPSELPFAAQSLNSTIIECSQTTGRCLEYRAQVVRDILLPLDPLSFSIVSWDRDRIVA